MTQSVSGLTAADFQGLSRAETIQRLREVVESLSLADRFRLLHDLGIYHAEESLSGAGSSLAETESLRRRLPALFQRLGVTSLLDVPCGDFHWMSRLDLSGLSYVGADIVPGLIESNRQRFPPPLEFRVLDVTADPLPNVDLILCRDLLIHLGTRDAARALANILRSGSRLLLASHYFDRMENLDIPSGDFRPVNLTRAPFDFPPPAERLDEDSRLEDGLYADRSMALWRLDELRRSDVPARLEELAG